MAPNNRNTLYQSALTQLEHVLKIHLLITVHHISQFVKTGVMKLELVHVKRSMRQRSLRCQVTSCVTGSLLYADGNSWKHQQLMASGTRWLQNLAAGLQSFPEPLREPAEVILIPVTQPSAEQRAPSHVNQAVRRRRAAIPAVSAGSPTCFGMRAGQGGRV